MRILVIEDESKLVVALRRGLESEGFTVDIATLGDEGLEMAIENEYALIVLDIMLPGMNGFLVCRSLRERHDWTPILMLSAKDGEHDQAEALETGADDYLMKPFSFVVLLAHIRALLRRTGTIDRASEYVAGDLRLDPVSHRVSRAGVAIELTSKEFAVLHYLMRRLDAVVTKQDILDDVWNFDYGGNVNIVEVYIRHLRKKIDEPFGRTSIKTIRGLGYRLDKDGR